MGSPFKESGRTSFKSVYRSVEELEALLVGVYGPSLRLENVDNPKINFRTCNFRDEIVSISDCYTSDDLKSSFQADSDDVLIMTRSKGAFAVHTPNGDYPLSRSLGLVFTMDHANGYSSTRMTSTTVIQIRRAAFDAALSQYSEDAPSKWSGVQSFSLASGFGHLVEALSNRYRENFSSRADCNYSETSLDLIRNAAMVSIAELASRESDLGRREKFIASRRNVMRAVELINSQTAPLTIHDLATSLDISVRALQDGFRKHLNTSPHSLLKTGRIEGARRDLLSGKAPSVREAATRWGFSNIARFNHEYFTVLGRYPKETLSLWLEDDDG